MASKSDMKGFYKQKKNADVFKKSKSKSKSKSTTPISSSSPSPSLAPTDGCDENEEMLRQFDMNMAYGPCLGMSRLERWERAKDLGLNPPEGMEDLLSSSKVRLDCLWYGCV